MPRQEPKARLDSYSSEEVGGGFLILSTPALQALEKLQSYGWEAFPVNVRKTREHGSTLLESQYYFLNIYLQKDVTDLSASELEPFTVLGETTYAIRSSRNKVAVKRASLGEDVLWFGTSEVCWPTIFVADSLRDAWCDLGVNPDTFDPCIDL